MSAPRVLITGGAGYIGSHTAKRLANNGFATLVYDNLSRGHRDMVQWGELVTGDIRDTNLLSHTLQSFQADLVLHFAAFAYVGESVSHPGLYYDNNVGGTLSLLQAMQNANVQRLVVSSTCATYGQPERIPITEVTPQQPLNPYGHTKLIMEQMIKDFAASSTLKHVALRYFNAAGADPDGQIGERHDPEPHLIPRLFMAQDGLIDRLEIMGDDYPTPDGTCIRDYIHVNDLADAHMAASAYLLSGGQSDVFNLGTGTGMSVRQIITAAEAITGRAIPHHIGPRRAGDPAILIANPAKAAALLNWKTNQSSVSEIISTAWHWHQKEQAKNRLASV